MTAWHMYIDGASSCNPGESGAGIVAYDEEGREILRESVYLGQMTNNMAEYEALAHALKRATESQVQDVSIYTDSLLVVNQVLGTYRVHNSTLREYVDKIKKVIRDLSSFKVKHIPRDKNKLADRLAKEAITKKGVDG
jgi:ribonuclease HI